MPHRLCTNALQVAGILCLLIVGRPLLSQTTAIRLTDQLECPRCQIRLVNSVRLTREDVSVSAPPSAIEVDSKGRIWVAVSDALPKVYAPDGTFLQFLGRKGAGPFEFAGAYGIARIPGDSMLVFDVDNSRASVVSSDLSVVRSIRLPSFFHPIVSLSWPDTVVVSGAIVTPAAAGWPLHLVSLGGSDLRVLSSLGYEQGQLRPNSPTDQAQVVAQATDGSFWSADVLRYRVSRWSAKGTRLLTFERTASWFATASRDWLGNPNTPPPPRIAGIKEDPKGLVWVVTHVASKNWRKGWPRVEAGAREVSVRSIRFDELFSSVVEVIDPQKRTVVARLESERYIVSVLSDGRFAVYSRDSDDVPVITLVRPQLVK